MTTPPPVRQRSTAASRVGVGAIFIAFIAVDKLLAARYQIVPDWVGYVLVVVMVGTIALSFLDRGNLAVRRFEHIVLLCGSLVALLLNVANLTKLSVGIVRSAQLEGRPLLLSAVAIWIGNMLIFSLLYWLIDRGGPEVRADDAPSYPDFDFPAMTDPHRVPADWRPTIVDYLFIGFTTNTAFSPTEAMPLTNRAKTLVMLQSGISLVTVVIVAARAVGMIQ